MEIDSEIKEIETCVDLGFNFKCDYDDPTEKGFYIKEGGSCGTGEEIVEEL